MYCSTALDSVSTQPSSVRTAGTLVLGANDAYAVPSSSSLLSRLTRRSVGVRPASRQATWAANEQDMGRMKSSMRRCLACARASIQLIVSMETMKSAHERDDVPERIEVRHLKLMRAIAEAGGVTRAAGRLHLSQSAVSHQLLALERDLGARLFDRVGKRMVPTAAGAHLVDAARRLLGELAELERSVDGRREATVPLRVTSSCYTSYNWLPAALAHFAERHPNLALEIVLEVTRRAVPALLADEIDVAIVTDPPRDDTWGREVVIASELVALASPATPVGRRPA